MAELHALFAAKLVQGSGGEGMVDAYHAGLRIAAWEVLRREGSPRVRRVMGVGELDAASEVRSPIGGGGAYRR